MLGSDSHAGGRLGRVPQKNVLGFVKAFVAGSGGLGSTFLSIAPNIPAPKPCGCAPGYSVESRVARILRGNASTTRRPC